MDPVLISDLSLEGAADLIRDQGIRLDFGAFSGNPHGNRWIGHDATSVYLIPKDGSEAARLLTEKKILDRLFQMGCPVPKILHATDSLQVRTKVTGVTLDESEQLVIKQPLPIPNRYHAGMEITKQGKVLAEELGKALADIQRAFSNEELKDLNLSVFRFDCERLSDTLRSRITESLFSRFNEVVSRYQVHEADMVLCHGDLGHHNLCSNPETGHLNGIFDFGDCCLALREFDFRYVPSNGLKFTDWVIGSYERSVGTEIHRRSVYDLHILSAAENLEYALKHPHHGLERCQVWLRDALTHLA